MKRVKVSFVDRLWWEEEDQVIVGDMGWTVCDLPDTITIDRKGIEKEVKDWIQNDSEMDEIGDVKTGFSIYVIYDAEAEIEDGAEVLYCDMLRDTYKARCAYAMTTRAGAYGSDLDRKMMSLGCPIVHYLP